MPTTLPGRAPPDAPPHTRVPAVRAQVAPPDRSPPRKVPQVQFALLGPAQEGSNGGKRMTLIQVDAGVYAGES